MIFSSDSKTTGAWTLPAYCPLRVFHLLRCLIGRGGPGVCLIPISPVLATVTPNVPHSITLLHGEKWRWWPWDERKAEEVQHGWAEIKCERRRNAHRPFWIALEPLGTPKGLHPAFTSALSNIIWTALIMYNTCYHNRAIFGMHVWFTMFLFQLSAKMYCGSCKMRSS